MSFPAYYHTYCNVAAVTIRMTVMKHLRRGTAKANKSTAQAPLTVYHIYHIDTYIFIYTINNDSPSSFHALLLVTFSLQVHHKEFQEAFLHLQTRNKCLRTTFHAVSVELLNSYIYNPDSVSCGFSFCPLGR